MTEAAREILRAKGYDEENGARPLARVIQEELKRPLGEELLFGKLEHGGHVVVDAEAAAEGKPSEKKLVFTLSRREARSTRARWTPRLN